MRGRKGSKPLAQRAAAPERHAHHHCRPCRRAPHSSTQASHPAAPGTVTPFTLDRWAAGAPQVGNLRTEVGSAAVSAGSVVWAEAKREICTSRRHIHIHTTFTVKRCSSLSRAVQSDSGCLKLGQLLLDKIVANSATRWNFA